jgi:hypothetical protein
VACRIVADDDDGEAGFTPVSFSSAAVADFTASITEAATCFPSIMVVTFLSLNDSPTLVGRPRGGMAS